MRVLFLHASREHTSEYAVHRLLADNVDPARVTCSFVQQKKLTLPPKSQEDTITWDFGRDMSLDPKPSKIRRATMMLRALPGSFGFLRRRVIEFQPDVLYSSQQLYEVYLGWLTSRLYHIPHIIPISYPVGPWLGSGILRILRMTPNLIACSEYVRQSALEQGVQTRQIETLLHGADLHEYAIPKDREWLHNLLGCPEICPIVLTAARIDPYKGYPELLKAFAIAHQQAPELRLAICGTGTTGTDYEVKIKQMVIELGISESTTFLGFQPDLPRVFSGADIFCLPTQFDALPLVFLGAMAAGLPVVAIRSGGVVEMVVDGETGLLADPGDVNCLAEHLLTLVREPDLATKMGEAGKLRAMRDFEPGHIAEQWANILYRRLNVR